MVAETHAEERVLPVRTGSPPVRFVRDLIALVRPGQWPKNVLVVSVPLLDLQTWNAAVPWRLAWAVLSFTLAASVVYVFNDLADRRRDATHPVKWVRPIASGRISPPVAVGYGLALLAVLIALLSLQPALWSVPILVYLLLNVAYSSGLKHTSLLDVFMVAAGFGLRLLLGYLALGTQISGWLFTSVFTLCLLLAVGKRRQELVSTDGSHRPALRGYTVALTEQLMVLSAMLAAGSYLLYLRTEAPLGSYGIVAAAVLAPPVLFGLFRYLQLALVLGRGEDPVRALLGDRILVINAVMLAGLSTVFLVASRLP